MTAKDIIARRAIAAGRRAFEQGLAVADATGEQGEICVLLPLADEKHDRLNRALRECEVGRQHWGRRVLIVTPRSFKPRMLSSLMVVQRAAAEAFAAVLRDEAFNPQVAAVRDREPERARTPTDPSLQP